MDKHDSPVPRLLSYNIVHDHIQQLRRHAREGGRGGLLGGGHGGASLAHVFLALAAAILYEVLEQVRLHFD